MKFVLLPSEVKHAKAATRRNEQNLWTNRYLRNCTRTTRHRVLAALCMIRPFTKLAPGHKVLSIYLILRYFRLNLCQIQESIQSVTSHALNRRLRCVHHMPNIVLLPSLGDHINDCAKDAKNCYVTQMYTQKMVRGILVSLTHPNNINPK
jgi:hypothetical protein